MEGNATELFLHSQPMSSLSCTDKEKVPVESIKYQTLISYVKNIFRLAIPNTIATSCWNLQFFIGYYFIGLLDDVKLIDGMSLGNTWNSIFGASLIYGFGTALSTFVSQYYGNKDYTKCGEVLNRAFMILAVVLIPCIIMQCFATPIFLYSGINPEVAEHAGRVAIGLIPILILYIPILLLEDFLIAQQIAKPQMVFQFINLLFYPLYCYFAVFILGWGMYGVVLARGISYSAYIVMLLIYMKYSQCCKDTIVAPSMNIFKGVKEYLSVALPSLVMNCLEWWGFEIMNIISARIGVAEMAANVIAFNYNGFIFMGTLGLGMASGALVGNSIGENNMFNAKMYIFLSVTLTTGISLFIGIILIIFRQFFTLVFTKDQEVMKIMKILMYLLVIEVIFDANQGVLTRILIAMGKQKLASIANLVGYYILMIPIGTIAAFVFGLGIYGIWIGLIFAGVGAVSGFLIIIYTVDWTQIRKEFLDKNPEGNN